MACFFHDTITASVMCNLTQGLCIHTIMLLSHTAMHGQCCCTSPPIETACCQAALASDPVLPAVRVATPDMRDNKGGLLGDSDPQGPPTRLLEEGKGGWVMPPSLHPP